MNKGKPTYEDLENLVKKYELDIVIANKEIALHKEENRKLAVENNFLQHYSNDCKQAEEELKRIEWLLTSIPKESGVHECAYVSPYGNLVEFNKNGFIRESVGEQILTDVASDYLNLLNTSSAVYEKNGDYALGIFSSGWCRFLDAASRELCNTNDNRKALDSGLWHCHESCWSRSCKIAIETGQPADIECDGGIRLFAVPIRVGDEVIGAINFGYGNPPRDEKTLRKIASKYNVDYDDLLSLAFNYESRPPYIVDLAKQRLIASARLIAEIAVRKQAEAALRESEEMIFNSQTVAHICSYSTTLNINELEKSTWVCSPEFYKIFGIDETYPHTIAGWAGFIHPNCREEIVVYHESVIREKKSFNREYKIIRINDGAERWVQGTGELVIDKEGNPIRMHGAIQDITDRKLAEEALRESEEKFREMANLLPQIIFESDNEGNLTYVNDNAFRIFNYPSDYPIIGKSSLDFYTPESRLKASERIRQKVSGNSESISNEYIMVRKDGSTFPALVCSNPIIKDGKPIGLRGIIINIEELKQAEEELRKSEEKLAITLNSIGDGVISTDINGTITTINPVAETLCGWKQTEALGKSLSDVFKIINAETRQIVADPVGIVLKHGETVGLANHTVLISRSGVEYQISDSAAPIKNKEGKIIWVVLVFSDVTENYFIQKRIKDSEERYGNLLST